MNNPHGGSARVIRPLSAVAFLLATFVLTNALLVGCGGGGAGDDTSTSMSGSDGDGAMGSGNGDGSMAGDEEMTPLALGEKIYTEKCALCHGPSGKGDGPGAAALDPKPRDHTDGAYMNARTNEQLLEVIANGKGQMTPWGNILSEDERHAVLTYVRTLAEPAYEGPTP